MTATEPTHPMSGKVALVTGASRGIGAAIAATLAGAGAHVVLSARDKDALSLLVQSLTSSGGQATAMPVDVTDEDSVKNLLAGISGRFGRLDAAVNNAAGGGRTPAPLSDWASEDFDSAIAVNLRGVFLCMKYEIELMLATGTGAAIVNMSSTAGEQGVAGLSGYTASKFRRRRPHPRRRARLCRQRNSDQRDRSRTYTHRPARRGGPSRPRPSGRNRSARPDRHPGRCCRRSTLAMLGPILVRHRHRSHRRRRQARRNACLQHQEVTAPRPTSNMISAARRESAQPKMTANGFSVTTSSRRPGRTGWGSPGRRPPQQRSGFLPVGVRDLRFATIEGPVRVDELVSGVIPPTAC